MAGDVVGYPLVATSGVALLELRAKQPGVDSARLRRNRPERQAQLRIQDTKGEHPFPVSALDDDRRNVEVPRGVSQLC